MITVKLQPLLISVTVPIDRTAEINYALVEDPTFTNTYILSRNKARLQQLSNKLTILHESLPSFYVMCLSESSFLSPRVNS